jgi:hypothetical protein
MSATQPGVWVDTSPQSFENRPHQSFRLNVRNFQIQLYTSFVDRSKWCASFYPNISQTVTLNAVALEDAKREAVKIARKDIALIAQQLSALDPAIVRSTVPGPPNPPKPPFPREFA